MSTPEFWPGLDDNDIVPIPGEAPRLGDVRGKAET